MFWNFLVLTYSKMKFESFLITFIKKDFYEVGGGDNIKNVGKSISSRLDVKFNSVF